MLKAEETIRSLGAVLLLRAGQVEARGLAQVYANGLPSLFGTNGPDEDFAEAYKYMLLSDAKVENLTLSIPALGQSNSVMQPLQGNNPKIGCLEALGLRKPI